jgi:hypothetical protein
MLLFDDHDAILILIQKASEGKWGTELWTITDIELRVSDTILIHSAKMERSMYFFFQWL